MGESDSQALIREICEELTVDIDPSSLKLYGIFEAQAHGKPAGTIVRMTCYTATYTGTLQPHAEITKLVFFGYERRQLSATVDHLIFTDLYKKGLID